MGQLTPAIHTSDTHKMSFREALAESGHSKFFLALGVLLSVLGLMPCPKGGDGQTMLSGQMTMLSGRVVLVGCSAGSLSLGLDQILLSDHYSPLPRRSFFLEGF